MNRASDFLKLETCDYVIETSEHGFGRKHFCIYYDIARQDYKVLDLLQGNGTFIVLQKPTALRKYGQITFGTCYLSFEVKDNNDIFFQFEGGAMKGQCYMFSKE